MVRWQVWRHVRVVRDDENRRAERDVQIADEPQNVGAGLRVEIACRLVRQQDRRIHRQRARNGDALALSARQLVRKMVHARGQLHEVEQLARAIVDLLPRPAAQVQRQRHVLDARQARQQIEELKDEAELVPPHRRQPIVCEAVEALAVERDGARRRPVQPADEIQQRRFSRSRGPDDRDHLPLRNLERDVLQRRDAPPAVEVLADVVETDQRRTPSNGAYGRDSWRPSYSSMRVRAQSGTGTGFAAA